jgi:hypothetical protein
MKRSKRISIRRIALGLAVAAVVPATAQARPMEMSGSDARSIHQAAASSSDKLYPGEIPSVVPVTQARRMEIPYLSHGVGVSAKDIGLPIGADDRSFSRQSPTPTVLTADRGDGYDFGSGNTIGGLVLILGAAGAALAIRHNRKTRLSPA